MDLGKRGLAIGVSVSMETNLVSLKVSEGSPVVLLSYPLRSPSARDRADKDHHQPLHFALSGHLCGRTDTEPSGSVHT